MSKRWLIALLLISFSFNLAVIGSAVYLRLIMPCPVEPFPHGQGPERRPQMDREHGFMRNDPEVMNLRYKFDDTKVNLMQELAQDPVNEAKVNAIIDSSLVYQNILEHKLGQKILAYRKTMSAAEAREHFLSRANNLRNRSHRLDQIRHRRHK